jgi:DNA-3-methyladenine glycosylase
MSLISFFDREVTLVARELLGATFLVENVGGVIVETEAYHPSDPAAHSFRGETERNRTMFQGPGRVYVYRSYGIHWCVNFVCGGAAAILIRALEPTAGIDVMTRRRGTGLARALCSGPGKLTEALAITKAHDGLMLDASPFTFIPARQQPPIVVGPRIGISKARELPWRFGIAESAYLSRRFAEPVG